MKRTWRRPYAAFEMAANPSSTSKGLQFKTYNFVRIFNLPPLKNQLPLSHNATRQMTYTKASAARDLPFFIGRRCVKILYAKSTLERVGKIQDLVWLWNVKSVRDN